MNATEAFLGDPAGWTHVRVALYDVHGLWGGRTCFVSGSGRVVAQIARVPQHEDRYAATVPPAEVARLLRALIETDFVTITFPQRPRRPDEACPTVIIDNAAGERRRVHKWAGDPHPGFESVYQRLHHFADQAQLGDCLYQGPLDPTFAPG